MQDFRKVRAWQRAQPFSVAVHRLVETFPKKGYSRLKTQMKKSAEAVPDNIAEACGAATQPDCARFLSVSIREATELENHIDRAFRFGLMSQRKFALYTSEIQTIRKMIVGLRESVVRTFKPFSEPAVMQRRSETRNGAGEPTTGDG